MISSSAAPKMTALPAMLPRIDWLFNQHGQAIPSATIGGTVASSAIQNQLSSVTETARPKFTNSPIHEFTNYFVVSRGSGFTISGWVKVLPLAVSLTE